MALIGVDSIGNVANVTGIFPDRRFADRRLAAGRAGGRDRG